MYMLMGIEVRGISSDQAAKRFELPRHFAHNGAFLIGRDNLVTEHPLLSLVNPFSQIDVQPDP